MPSSCKQQSEFFLYKSIPHFIIKSYSPPFTLPTFLAALAALAFLNILSPISLQPLS
jgi:hypothetical protein